MVSREYPTNPRAASGLDPEAVHEAARLMADNGIRRLPVCEGDTLVGIITVDDVTELLADEQQQLGDVLRAQRPEY